MKNFLLILCWAMASTLTSKGADPATPPPPSKEVRKSTSPSGYEGFFPSGYSTPKMKVSGNTVVIVGPTPRFGSREMQGAKTGTDKVQTGDQTNNRDLEKKFEEQDGNTELMYASTTGDLNRVKKLFEDHVNVNATNYFGSTALMGASAAGHDQIVQLLLDHGANPNLKSKNKSTALAFAIRNKHPQVIYLLKSAGAREK